MTIISVVSDFSTGKRCEILDFGLGRLTERGYAAGVGFAAVALPCRHLAR